MVENVTESQPYRAITGFSGLWWTLAVFGLFAVVGAALLSILPVTFAWVVLFVLIFAVIRKKAAVHAAGIGALCFLLGLLFLGPLFYGVWVEQTKLAQYKQPIVSLNDRLELSGDVLIQAPTTDGSYYVNPSSSEPSRDTLDLLLLEPDIDSVTIALDGLSPEDGLSERITPKLDYAITFNVSPNAACQTMLSAYHEGYADPTPQWRDLGERLAQECVEVRPAPFAQFDYKIRYGIWRDADDPWADGGIENKFSFGGPPPARPYRPGVRVGFAQIENGDGELLLSRFVPRAHSLAMPLQIDRRQWRGGFTLAYKQIGLGDEMPAEEYNRLPSGLAFKLSSPLYVR